jgi:alkylated DNA repair dioxygenase AlkB
METSIPGLFIYKDFISEEMERLLLEEIDRQTWIVDYKRRLQYYGYRNELDAPYDLIEFPVAIPPMINDLAKTIVQRKMLDNQPDQVIINEYVPGEGIIPHKDRNYFENQICGINLGSGCIMRFTKDRTREVVDLEIPRRSAYIMQDEVRKKWKHGIPPRKKDNVNGTIQHRDRRVSITYRKVKPAQVRPINPNGKVAQLLKDSFNIIAK